MVDYADCAKVSPVLTRDIDQPRHSISRLLSMSPPRSTYSRPTQSATSSRFPHSPLLRLGSHATTNLSSTSMIYLQVLPSTNLIREPSLSPHEYSAYSRPLVTTPRSAEVEEIVTPLMDVPDVYAGRRPPASGMTKMEAQQEESLNNDLPVRPGRGVRMVSFQDMIEGPA